MGARVSEPTIQKVLREAGFHPTGGHPLNLDKWRAMIKNAIRGLGFFFIRTAKDVWLNVLLVIDLHTKEILERVPATRGAPRQRIDSSPLTPDALLPRYR